PGGHQRGPSGPRGTVVRARRVRGARGAVRSVRRSRLPGVATVADPWPAPGIARLALLPDRRLHLARGERLMEATFIAALAGLTSIGAFYFGARVLRLSSMGLAAAIGKMLESIGIVLIFLAVNLIVAVLIVLIARSLTGFFISAYVTDDAVWLGL